MRKKPYGGLPPRQAKLIRRYLSDARASGNTWPVHNLWVFALTGMTDTGALAAYGKTDTKTVKAMLAGMSVLKRKRVGRIRDYNAYYSFARIGIHVPHVT